MESHEITFHSVDSTCAGLHLRGQHTTAEPRPCVVMAHGFGGTVDGGILGFAEGFAAAGFDVLLFDYRGFGRSAGTPRQLVSYRRQRADYRAAIHAARSIEGVDPDQIVLWGTSYSGGHVLAVAAADPRVAAVVSMTPSVDGLATLTHLAGAGGPGPILRLAGAGIRDALGAAIGRAPRHVAAIGPAGSGAVIAKDGALEAMVALAGPTWRNEVCARVALEIAVNRPIGSVPRLQAPLLVQLGDNDTVVPAAAALAAADRSGGPTETLRYPVDHFDVYAGRWHARLLADQVDFIARNLGRHDQHRPVTA
ncbi:alpha/beta hydrolase [Streptomyces bobili]|uniref:Lysophospholipase n=1 Tax=Streptomyces bobili TaxID=67280 RepID=A0ABZ1R7L2_9ACTN|nr:alpha/beta fold hydrolase [Streptomyces bobili]